MEDVFPIVASESLAVARYSYVFFVTLEKAFCATWPGYFVTVPNLCHSMSKRPGMIVQCTILQSRSTNRRMVRGRLSEN